MKVLNPTIYSKFLQISEKKKDRHLNRRIYEGLSRHLPKGKIQPVNKHEKVLNLISNGKNVYK